MLINVFSVTDKKQLDIVYVLLNSVKNARDKDDTEINYHLIVEDLDEKTKQYFDDLNDDKFRVYYFEAKDYAHCIHPPKNSYLDYISCLAPSIFHTFDKMLYLDTDTVFVNSGIEDLWSIDLGTKYVAAVTDIQIDYDDVFQKYNTKKKNGDTYFNSGVMLLNLRQIRIQGIDKKIQKYLLNWPKELKCISFDQTLLNYVFGSQVKIISTKWNNSILAMVDTKQQFYRNYYCTDNLMQKIKEAVIIHLKGPKPWEPVSMGTEMHLPNRKLAQAVYGEVYNQLGKHEEF